MPNPNELKLQEMNRDASPVMWPQKNNHTKNIKNKMVRASLGPKATSVRRVTTIAVQATTANEKKIKHGNLNHGVPFPIGTRPETPSDQPPFDTYELKTLLHTLADGV